MMTPHAELVRTFELRMLFEDLVHDLTLPKVRRELTVDNAKWFLKHASTFNNNRVMYPQAKGYVEEYMNIYNGGK